MNSPKPLHTLHTLHTRLLVALLAGIGAAAQAATPTTAAPLDLATAEQLAQTARMQCRTLGKDIAVAIVDAGGAALLQSRSASVGPHNLEAARRKAFTSLSTRQPTLALGRAARSQPDTAGLQYLPELLLLGGGQPLRRGDGVIGAIGVAGGGGPENDDACALAAAQSLQP